MTIQEAKHTIPFHIILQQIMPRHNVKLPYHTNPHHYTQNFRELHFTPSTLLHPVSLLSGCWDRMFHLVGDQLLYTTPYRQHMIPYRQHMMPYRQHMNWYLIDSTTSCSAGCQYHSPQSTHLHHHHQCKHIFVIIIALLSNTVMCGKYTKTFQKKSIPTVAVEVDFF